MVASSIILAAIFDISPDWKLNVNLHSQINISYADLTAILLAGVSILVTILGVIVAIVTFVGYKQIKDAAISKAEEHVKESIKNEEGELYRLVKDAAISKAEEYVKESIKNETGELHRLVKKEVQEITYQHLRGSTVQDDWPSEENGETS